MDRILNAVGVLVIVGSLIFAGMELNHSARLAEAASSQSRIDEFQQANRGNLVKIASI